MLQISSVPYEFVFPYFPCVYTLINQVFRNHIGNDFATCDKENLGTFLNCKPEAFSWDLILANPVDLHLF